MNPLKLLICVLLLATPAFARTTRTVTIDHTKVGSSDQTNFAVLFTGTYSYLATVANGGMVQNASGFDVEFWSDAGGTMKLAWETELYTASNGQVAYWVNVPTVSHTADTVIYLTYGDASVTTDQSNATGTWNSNFRGVYHLQQTAGPYLDSTSNATNSTGGTHPTAVSSTLIAGTNAQSFVAGSSQGISFTTFPWSSPAGAGAWTASGWFKTSTGGASNPLWDSRGLSGANGTPVVYLSSSCFLTYFRGPTGPTFAGSTNYCDGNWHYYVVTGIFTMYVDNTLIATGAGQNQLSFPTGGYFGQSYDPVYSTEVLQELQFQNTIAETADWVTASYNSQHSPSTFYTIGTASSPSANAFWGSIP